MASHVMTQAERFTRQRLQALAHAQAAASGKVRAGLFLCVHNAGRSQMALGWFRHLAADRAIAWSGASEPVFAINPGVLAAMAAEGIDISHEFSKPWTDELSWPPTSSSPWAAATPACSCPASTTKTGN